MKNQLLKNKKGIIFGALDERSIAWKTALKVYEEIIFSNSSLLVKSQSQCDVFFNFEKEPLCGLK